MENNDLKKIVGMFDVKGTLDTIAPLGNGLINDTYKVCTSEPDAPDYVLQRINHQIFQDVELLQHNIEAVTRHIREKLSARGVADLDRRVLRFIPTSEGKTYAHVGDEYWRLSVFIPRTKTYEAVTPAHAEKAGEKFGGFEAMLVDLPEHFGEVIPDFHNMELRLSQLREAVANDAVGRVSGIRDMLAELEASADDMCLAEQLGRAGKLKKRICHCDTKVNNMLYDGDGEDVLCVIDLDTVMPSYVFSDYGDFLRTGANFVAEDCPELEKVGFNMEIFKSFTRGYLRSAGTFLEPVETEHLPYGAALFPFMQCVRFLADYINGDTYYKINYPEHNLVRAENQLRLFRSVKAHEEEMKQFIRELGF